MELVVRKCGGDGISHGGSKNLGASEHAPPVVAVLAVHVVVKSNDAVAGNAGSSEAYRWGAGPQNLVEPCG